MSHTSYFRLLKVTMLASKGVWANIKDLVAIRRIEGSDSL